MRRHRRVVYAWCLCGWGRSTDTCPLSSSCPAPLPSSLVYTPCDPLPPCSLPVSPLSPPRLVRCGVAGGKNEQTTARRPSSCTKNLLQTEARVPYRAAQPRCPGFPAPLSSPGVVGVVWCAPLPCSYSDQQAAEFVAAGVYNKRRHLLGPATGKQGAVGHERRHRLFAYAWCLYPARQVNGHLSVELLPASLSPPSPLVPPVSPLVSKRSAS